jgi:uncharacterized membrane protein YqjE
VSRDDGMVGNLRGLGATAIRALRTRLELAAIELQVEKALAVRQLVVAAATLYLLSFGTLAAIAWIAVSVEPATRGVLLCGIAIAFLALGSGGALWLYYGRARAKPLLETTIAVLKGDEHALSGPGR